MSARVCTSGIDDFLPRWARTACEPRGQLRDHEPYRAFRGSPPQRAAALSTMRPSVCA